MAFHVRLKYYELGLVAQEEIFKYISILSSGGHFVQQRKPVCGILLEGNMRNISVKLFWIRIGDSGGDVI